MDYQAKPEHHAKMRDFHYAAADAFAAESERYPITHPKHRELLNKADAALELAEQCRVKARA